MEGGGKKPHVDPARDVRDDIMDANGVPELLDRSGSTRRPRP
jgi:hypothetical protein